MVPEDHVGKSIRIDERVGKITEQNAVNLRIEFPGDPMGMIMRVADFERDFVVKESDDDNA